MNKKFFGVILSALLLSACAAEDIPEIPETTAETSAESDTITEISETVSETTFSEWLPGDYPPPLDDENENSVTFIDDETFIKNYFNEHGFRYENKTIYVDMDKFPDTDDPFENISDNYINYTYGLVLSGVDGRNINFVNGISPWVLTIADYSGECDFSNINKEIYFDNYMGGDLSSYKRVGYITFRNYSGEYPFNGLNENITYLSVENDSIDPQAIAGINNSDITDVEIIVKNYRDSDIDFLVTACPDVNLKYCEYSYDRQNDSEDLIFYCSAVLDNSTWRDKPELKSEREIYPYDDANFFYWGENLMCSFSNFTDKDIAIISAKLCREEKDGEFTEIPFADGSSSYEINTVIKAKKGGDCEIPKELLSAEKFDAGAYRIEFETGVGTIGRKFFISHGTELTELSDEQKQAYDKARAIADKYFMYEHYLDEEYVSTHTAEDFLAEICEGFTYDQAYQFAVMYGFIDENGNLQEIYADGSSNIMYMGSNIAPICSDDKEAFLKETIFYGHSDDPYIAWREARIYHMVNTEDGWRFDKFYTRP